MTKALRLLDCFRLKDVPMGVTELARRSQLPKSTAFRMLTHLEEAGYVERHGKQYRPAWLLFELGTGVDALRSQGLRSTAMPHMADLFALTRQSVHLGVLSGREIVHAGRIRGSQSVVSPIRYGGRAPATCSAMGKILLAHQGPEQIRAVLESPLLRMTKHSITAPGTLFQQLKAAREQGYATEREETALGLVSIAVPITSGNEIRGAIALAGRPGSFQETAILPHLRKTAELIARALASAG